MSFFLSSFPTKRPTCYMHYEIHFQSFDTIYKRHNSVAYIKWNGPE